MKVRVEAEELAEALSSVSGVVLSASNSVTYKCVLISVNGSKMYIRGTDLMTYIERVLEVDNLDSEEGVWLCVFETMQHYVKTSSGKLLLVFKDNELKIYASKTDFCTVKLRDTKEYTIWPKWSSLTKVVCNGTKLIDAIAQSVVSASPTLIKPVLHGVSIKSCDVQAANGFRFQVVSYSKKRSKVDILIPFSSCSHMGSISRPVVEIGVGDRHFGVKSENGEIRYFVLREGATEYPLFRQFTLPKVILRVVLAVDKLVTVLAKADGFVDSDYRMAKITASPTSVKVYVNSEDKGSYTGEVKCKGKGKETELSLDVKDIAAFLEQTNSLNVTLELSEGGPYRLVDTENKEFLYVAFPLIVKE